MTDKKLTALDASTTVDFIYGELSGVSKKITSANVVTQGGASLAASKLLGRGSAGGSGVAEEITLGSGLSMSSTTLTATGAGYWVNVTDFGATGNGSTDDTAALNACFASVMGTGATVLIPAGSYKTTDTIVVGDATGGAGAPASFISILCPAGPDRTVLSYQGLNDGRPALLFAKNKYFTCTGFNVHNDTGSRGTSVGMMLGGAGAGSFGTQVLQSTFIECSVFNFHIGITDGNFGACSEIVFISQTIGSCDIGHFVADFNSLDHTFISCGLTDNGIGIECATESHWVYGGSASNNLIDFQVDLNATTFSINGFRSEGAGIAVHGNLGNVKLVDCLFKDPTHGGIGVGTTINGVFNRISIDDCVFHGFVAFDHCRSITMVNSTSAIDPNTNLPFSILASAGNHGLTHVFAKNNLNADQNVTTPVVDFDGFFKQVEQVTSFNPIQYGVGIQKLKQEQVSANTGAPFPYDTINIGYVRQLAEGPGPNAYLPFTTSLATNAITGIGSPTLHFASVTDVVPNMIVEDSTTGSAISSNTYVLYTTSTTVVLSANVAAPGVGSGDTITFSSSVGALTPGKNLRVMGQFATSDTLAITFKRNVTINTGGGQSGTFVATSGIFFKSDVGKPIKVAGQGNSGWTDWFGAGLAYTDSTHLITDVANQQAPSIVSSVAVIGEDEPDANYMVVVTGDKNETFYVDTITASGFTVHSSNASSTATITALIIR